MRRDTERIERIERGLDDADLDAIVCALPANVLLLSGYWPVVGTALAIATRAGRVVVLAPRDEQELAEQGWADQVVPFEPGSLQEITRAMDVVPGPLRDAARALGIERGRVGYEGGAVFEPASYAAMHFYGAAMVELLSQTVPAAAAIPAGALLARLRSVKTAPEIDRIRTACRIAGRAFAAGAGQINPGGTETELAARFRAPLSILGTGHDGVERADGFTFCMSGSNSARAFGAYARSRAKPIAAHEFVLVHCNSSADGYWTDITRTYCTGAADRRQRELYDAVFAARAAALDAIRPGVDAAAVDRAARAVLAARGFAKDFKHSTGHGVGFAAINHNALPRIHPQSEDVLESGMVFNVEPAIYLDGYAGLRHCDMVAVTGTGVDLLTPFQASIDELIGMPSATTPEGRGS